ncbi:hypothetical protein QQF64_030498 [Cirrhinus molitorella]|uniref:Secreted protein n=1 Tax=Cirrhinus molitorella TaxID=172907 RepID=A0ABR3N3U0_9TELE
MGIHFTCNICPSVLLLETLLASSEFGGCMWVIGHGGKWRKCSYGKDSASENSWCLSFKQREYYPSLSTVSDEWIKETIPASTSGWSTSQIIVVSV